MNPSSEDSRSGKVMLAIAQCLLGGAAVVMITFACFRLGLGLPTPTFLYLIVVVLLSLRGSFVSSAIVSFLAVGCLDYFFVTPRFSLGIRDPIDVVAIGSFLTTSAVITHLVSRVRRLMQEKLRQSEAYLSEAQSLSHTGSFGWKPSTGDIVWSEETFRIFQYAPGTRPTVDLVLQRVHPEDSALVLQTIERASREGSDFDIAFRLLMPDGSVRHSHVVAHAKKDLSGGIEFVGAVMDVTERKRSEEALSKAQADLAHVARVTTVGELAASIAHEVNQPLAAVVTNANACLRWLDHQPPELGETRDAVRRIVRDGTRGSEVIARIRGLLKKELPQRERLGINNVVRESLALARAGLQGISVQTDLSEGLPLVYADRVQLQQVLLNLTVNAIDAMKAVPDHPRVLRVTTKDIDGAQVLVSVRDSGIGLAGKPVEQIFETFYTTKPDGLGMGLSICRSIVEGYGGRLWAEANEGPGATFLFTIPVGDEASE